jgi:hypothetical protein
VPRRPLPRGLLANNDRLSIGKTNGGELPNRPPRPQRDRIGNDLTRCHLQVRSAGGSSARRKLSRYVALESEFRLISGVVSPSSQFDPANSGISRYLRRRALWHHNLNVTRTATDTSDTVFVGNVAHWGNCRNCTLRSDSLVTGLNRGYYHSSVGFTDSCGERW